MCIRDRYYTLVLARVAFALHFAARKSLDCVKRTYAQLLLLSHALARAYARDNVQSEPVQQSHRGCHQSCSKLKPYMRKSTTFHLNEQAIVFI